MNFKILLVAILALSLAACNQLNKEHDDHEGHNHSEETEIHDDEAHQKVTFQYTSYSDAFELFAEADAFIVNEKANVLSHFSTLPDFKAVEYGKVTITLSVNGKETQQTLNEPTRKGIYRFDIQPATPGKGKLTFKITNDKGTFEVVVPEVTVFAHDKEAHEASEKLVVSKTNTTVFTKEQSWKIVFATELPKIEPFGQIIKTTALVKSAQSNEQILIAKSSGIVVLTSNSILEGQQVSAGQVLFSILGSTMADNNISVKYAEAKSNNETASANYERAVELAKDKIVSAKDLQSAKNQYENSKAIYENLRENFSTSGQFVTSSTNGFVKQVFVKNGSYVEAGQAMITISQNETFHLYADVPQRYATILANVQSANIRNIYNQQTYNFEQLNGKVLSYGKAANSDNFLIPIILQIDNNGNLIDGSFVELYLKTLSNEKALTIPNTSLLEEQGSFFVWVQVTPELFEKREVHIGSTDGICTEIMKGITANERIVSLGAMLIKLAQATGSLDAHSGHVH